MTLVEKPRKKLDDTIAATNVARTINLGSRRKCGHTYLLMWIYPFTSLLEKAINGLACILFIASLKLQLASLATCDHHDLCLCVSPLPSPFFFLPPELHCIVACRRYSCDQIGAFLSLIFMGLGANLVTLARRARLEMEKMGKVAERGRGKNMDGKGGVI